MIRKDFNREMDQKVKGIDKSDDRTDDEVVMSDSVEKCLQISDESTAQKESTDQWLARLFCVDNKKVKQIERHINQMTDQMTSLSTESSNSQSFSHNFGSNAVHNEVPNEDSEDDKDIYFSDSDSLPEMNGLDKSESCDHSYDITEDKDSKLNAVNGAQLSTPEPLVTTYPLKCSWQFWFWKAEPGVKVIWEEALQPVCKPFDSVDEFWRLYHHIIPVHTLVPPSDYCVFKDGIKPKWEDPQNINGGKWTLDFAKGPNRTINPQLDEIWLEVLLCMIGEGFNEFGEDICGAVVNIRSKADRISVWTANANKSVSNLKIGEILKIRSGYEGKMKYDAHSTTQRIAEAKERLLGAKLFLANKPKTSRRSCVF